MLNAILSKMCGVCLFPLELATLNARFSFQRCTLNVLLTFQGEQGPQGAPEKRPSRWDPIQVWGFGFRRWLQASRPWWCEGFSRALSAARAKSFSRMECFNLGCWMQKDENKQRSFGHLRKLKAQTRRIQFRVNQVMFGFASFGEP